MAFLKTLRLRHRGGFTKIAELLEKYDIAMVESGQVFRGIVHELRDNEDMLDDFNEFLNEDRRVREVSCDQIAELFNHVYDTMQKVTPDKVKFMRFLNVSDELGKALDEVKVMSLEELGEMILEAVGHNGTVAYWGQNFIEALDAAIKDYITAQKKLPNKTGKNGVQSPPAVQDKQIPEPPKSTKACPPDVKTTKTQNKPLAVLAPTNGTNMNANQPKQALTYTSKDPPVIQMQEELQQFNLRVEAEVILALKAYLSPQAYLDLIKSLQLFTLAVISYQEFLTMNEHALKHLDKSVCLALREMVESRMASIQRLSCFNIRLATIRSEDTTHNHRYFRIISQIASQEQYSDGIVNKSYIAIASGHESAGNLDDPVAAKVPKNAAELTLYKVEDEMHELDVVLSQFRVALNFIERIAKPEVPQTTVDMLCDKIGSVRVLSLLYGQKGPAVLEELRNRQPSVLQIVKDRLVERIGILLNGKKTLVDTNWATVSQLASIKLWTSARRV